MSVELGEIAPGDENRCGYTVHANGNWGDHRCELVIEHRGPHAIGLRHHAMPLVGALMLLAAETGEERDALHKRVKGLERIKSAFEYLAVESESGVIETEAAEHGGLLSRAEHDKRIAQFIRKTLAEEEA